MTAQIKISDKLINEDCVLKIPTPFNINNIKEEIKQELKEELLDEILEHIRIHYYDR